MASTVEAVIDEPVVVVRAKSLSSLIVFVAVLAVVFLLTAVSFAIFFVAGQREDTRQRAALCAQVEDSASKLTEALIGAGKRTQPPDGTPEREQYDELVAQFRKDTAVNCNL